MKSISIKNTRGILVGTKLKCIDNTGAKILEVISVRGFKGVKNQIPSIGIGGIVTCAVKSGNAKLKHEVVKAVIVRQKRPYKRPNGVCIHFEDNAAVIVDDKFEPKGKEIKSVIAKEVIERFSSIGKIARAVG
ncbi:MAG: 50S ribosomal protein L14 [Candidatus Aenigmarchaeota archaeon ex4484_52]|nr:MAG: 50S ribosomal protein L14 [Candidatus Aenigmarchaeota archaeon ex4484_52]